MVCKNCGYEFFEGCFCPECGTKNEEEPVLPEQSEQPVEQTVIQPEPVLNQIAGQPVTEIASESVAQSVIHQTNTSTEPTILNSTYTQAVQTTPVYASGNIAYNGASEVNIAEAPMPFYYKMWFISILFWVGWFVWIVPIATIILFVLRIKNYPELRKPAIKSILIQVGIVVALGIIALIL